MTVIPDRGQEHFLTKDNKSFTLDCISEYKETSLTPNDENAITIKYNYTICCTETPFKLIDAK